MAAKIRFGNRMISFPENGCDVTGSRCVDGGSRPETGRHVYADIDPPARWAVARRYADISA